jgi:Sodium/hydrogen exchanger family
MAASSLPFATAFGHGAAAFGALLVLGVLATVLLRTSFLSLTPAFVLAGFALGEGGAGFLRFPSRSGFVVDVASVALIVILFRDGLEVDGELLRREWHLPVRKLIVAMPLTAGLVALAAKAFTSLSWTEAFLLGALLSPTDPVLSSRVITNLRVPAILRHSLNLESGLNDGLALAPREPRRRAADEPPSQGALRARRRLRHVWPRPDLRSSIWPHSVSSHPCSHTASPTRWAHGGSVCERQATPERRRITGHAASLTPAQVTPF